MSCSRKIIAVFYLGIRQIDRRVNDATHAHLLGKITFHELVHPVASAPAQNCGTTEATFSYAHFTKRRQMLSVRGRKTMCVCALCFASNTVSSSGWACLLSRHYFALPAMALNGCQLAHLLLRHINTFCAGLMKWHKICAELPRILGFVLRSI